MPRANAEATISAQNNFTDWVGVFEDFNISVGDPGGGTVTLQRSFNGGSTALDVKDYTEATEEIGYAAPADGAVYRLGVKTGNYGSGPIYVRLGC